MEIYKELARVFSFHSGIPANRLEKQDPKLDKIMSDVAMLLQATYSLGYADGMKESFDQTRGIFHHFEDQQTVQRNKRRLEWQEYLQKTSHLKREENK